MFSLKEFLKEGFLKAVGKMADYQIILNAAGWFDKGVFDENDLAEIQTAINAQYIVDETPAEGEETTEESSVEDIAESIEETPTEETSEADAEA